MTRREGMSADELRTSYQEHLRLGRGLQIYELLSKITDLTGEYSFLAPDYACDVRWKTQRFTSVTAALPTPITWGPENERMIRALLRDKFLRNRDLLQRLQATETLNLCPKLWPDFQGEYRLGPLLEQVRTEAQQGKLVHAWLNDQLTLPPTRNIPALEIEINRVKFKFGPLGFWFLGDEKCGNLLPDAICAVGFDAVSGVFLFDLGSRFGTFVNCERIEPFVPRKLKPGQVFFAAETEVHWRLDCKVARNFLKKRENELLRNLEPYRHHTITK